MPARPTDPPARNEFTHVQFRMTPRQKAVLVEKAPPGMSVHQAAKWMLLKTVDKRAATEMADRAAEGFRRLTT